MFKNICKATAVTTSAGVGGFGIFSFYKAEAEKQMDYFKNGEQPPFKYVPMGGWYTPRRPNQEPVVEENITNNGPQ